MGDFHRPPPSFSIKRMLHLLGQLWEEAKTRSRSMSQGGCAKLKLARLQSQSRRSGLEDHERKVWLQPDGSLPIEKEGKVRQPRLFWCQHEKSKVRHPQNVSISVRKTGELSPSSPAEEPLPYRIALRCSSKRLWHSRAVFLSSANSARGRMGSNSGSFSIA
jgi:hypothetical protein